MSPHPWSDKRAASLAAIVLILLPAVLALAFVAYFGVNVVNYDQWEFVPVIEKSYNGTLTLGDLFAQHNEHRLFFPRIAMLALAHATQYDTMAEMYSSWAISLAILAIVFALYVKKFGHSLADLLRFVPIAWLLFSFRQFENMLWGWQIQVYLCIFGFLAAIYLLSITKKLDVSLAGAILAGILSTFSFFNGLLTWPVGLAFILLSGARDKVRIAALWSVSGILSCALYFYGWHNPSIGSSTGSVIGHIANAGLYFVCNVGSALAFERGNAIGIGIMLLGLLSIMAFLLIKNKLVGENAVWLAFIMFGLAVSLACAVGRSDLGIEQALSSRYSTFTGYTVIGLYLASLSLLNKNKDSPGERYYIFYHAAIVVLIILGLIVGYSGGIYLGQTMHDNGRQAIETIKNFQSLNDTQLSQLYPLPDKVRNGAAILMKYKLNVFS